MAGGDLAARIRAEVASEAIHGCEAASGGMRSS